jgi:signal transduction histidine kinase
MTKIVQSRPQLAIKRDQKGTLRLLLGEEKDTKRIARELHHDLPNSLSILKLDLERAIHQVEGNQIKLGIESLESLSRKIQEIGNQLRRIGMYLWPPTLDDLGILATVSWLCREFQNTYSGVQITIQTDIQEHDIPDFLKYAIYKILQEALENVAKHSKANLVHLFLSKSNSTIELTLQDNGEGFDIKREALADSRPGLGLNSMRKRTEITGGSFAMDSAIGKGTIIRASWPIQTVFR